MPTNLPDSLADQLCKVVNGTHSSSSDQDSLCRVNLQGQDAVTNWQNTDKICRPHIGTGVLTIEELFSGAKIHLQPNLGSLRGGLLNEMIK